MINILILSVGTRNKIVQYFKKELNDNGLVIAADCNELAPALYDADKSYIVPKITDEKYLDVIDVMKREELAILNTIATAEGTIEVAIRNTDKILQGSKVLILGFGRVAKILASKFSKLSAIVTCAARKISDLAWIKAYGYYGLDINNMLYDLKEFAK